MHTIEYPDLMPTILNIKKLTENKFEVQEHVVVNNTRTKSKYVRDEDSLFPVEEFIFRALGFLIKHIACKNCGILSGLPDIDTNRLKEELSRNITIEWLHQQVEALGSHVSFSEHLARVYDERITQQVAQEIEDEMYKPIFWQAP